MFMQKITTIALNSMVILNLTIVRPFTNPVINPTLKQHSNEL